MSIAHLSPAVDVDQLVIRYRATTALSGVSLRAGTGRITAVLGPNGAGKSSLLRTLCTLLQPTQGTVRVFGLDVEREPIRVRQHLGVVFQEQTLDRELTVERNLRFHARLYGISRRDTSARIDDLLGMLGLTDRRRDRVETLSGGLARHVEIARALLHQPRLLILDEPTTGLDPQSRRTVWDDLRGLRARLGISIVYSTHYMDEAEYADTITILRDGHVVQTGTPSVLKASLGDSGVLLRTHDDQLAENNLTRAGYDVFLGADGVSVRTSDPEDAIGALVTACFVSVLSVSVWHPTLDDVFLAAALGPDPGALNSEHRK